MKKSQAWTIALGITAASLVGGSGASATNLTPPSASSTDSNVITVCEGNSLSTVDDAGNLIPSDELDVLVRQVDALCDAGVGSAQTFEEYSSSQLGIEARASGGEYANVAAQINVGPGVMGISAYANSIPLDGKEKELGCIYRQQDFDGPAETWQSCGAAGTTSQTYLTTRSNEFCPVPGTRWEAMATLYADDIKMEEDLAVAIAQ
jgi:hypothetical protein